MRILYHHRIASKDGQITHIEEMVEALRGLGHEVAVVGPAVHKSDTGQGGSAGWVGTLKARLPGALYELAEACYSLVAFRRLRIAVAKFKPDVIYERYALYQPAGVWVSKITGIPLLLEVNAPYAIARRKYAGLKMGWLADRFERYTFRGASRVFPVTRVLGDMLQGMGVDGKRIRVVPNGINPKDYTDLPSVSGAKARFGLQDRMVIGFIGFVREWDQLDRVVNWLHRRPVDDSACLLVVGDGPVRGELEAQAASLGVAHKLIFTGVIPRQSVPAAAQAFDIALQTALVPYASPLCLFEYMALGKAILAPDQPNHHEVLERGMDCDMYDPKSDDCMETRLDVLSTHAERRHALGQAARATFERRRFVWAGNAQRVIDAAAELVPSRDTTIQN
jgi:glycosyltransferase involved in cell wall biosynthesis